MLPTALELPFPRAPERREKLRSTILVNVELSIPSSHVNSKMPHAVFGLHLLHPFQGSEPLVLSVCVQTETNGAYLRRNRPLYLLTSLASLRDTNLSEDSVLARRIERLLSQDDESSELALALRPGDLMPSDSHPWTKNPCYNCFGLSLLDSVLGILNPNYRVAISACLPDLIETLRMLVNLPIFDQCKRGMTAFLRTELSTSPPYSGFVMTIGHFKPAWKPVGQKPCSLTSKFGVKSELGDWSRIFLVSFPIMSCASVSEIPTSSGTILQRGNIASLFAVMPVIWDRPS